MKMSFKQHKINYTSYNKHSDVFENLKEKFKANFNPTSMELAKQYFKEKHKFSRVPSPSLVYQLAEFHPDEFNRIFQNGQPFGQCAYYDCTYDKKYSWLEGGIANMLDDLEEEIFILSNKSKAGSFLLIVYGEKRKVDTNDDVFSDEELELIYLNNAQCVETITFDLTINTTEDTAIDYQRSQTEVFASWVDYTLNPSRPNTLLIDLDENIQKANELINAMETTDPERKSKFKPVELSQAEFELYKNHLCKYIAIAEKLKHMYYNNRPICLLPVLYMMSYGWHVLAIHHVLIANHPILFMAEIDMVNQLANELGIKL